MSGELALACLSESRSLCHSPSGGARTLMWRGAGLGAPASSGTNCSGYCFPKSKWFAVSLLLWLIGKHMLGIYPQPRGIGTLEGFFFLLSVRLNILKDDLYLDILPHFF